MQTCLDFQNMSASAELLVGGFPDWDDRYRCFAALGPSASNPILHTTDRWVSYWATKFCTIRLSSTVPLKPCFQPQNANSPLFNANSCPRVHGL